MTKRKKKRKSDAQIFREVYREDFLYDYEEYLFDILKNAAKVKKLRQGVFSKAEFEWILQHEMPRKKKPKDPKQLARDRQRKLNVKKRLQKSAISLLIAPKIGGKEIFSKDEWNEDILPFEVLDGILSDAIERNGYMEATRFANTIESALRYWSSKMYGETAYKPEVRISMIPIDKAK